MMETSSKGKVLLKSVLLKDKNMSQSPPRYSFLTKREVHQRTFYTSGQNSDLEEVTKNCTKDSTENCTKNYRGPRCALLWCHGWGMDSHSFDALISLMPEDLEHYLVDFAGFGQAKLPPNGWGITDYAKDLEGALRSGDAGFDRSLPVILIGHSFGCTVALELAKIAPDLFDQVVMIAPPGVALGWQKVKRSFKKSLAFLFRRARPYLSKEWVEKLRAVIGSADYLASQGVMRQCLVKVVSYDTESAAREFQKKALIIGSDRDQITPLSTLCALAGVMPRAAVVKLSGFDHHTILTEGSVGLVKRIKKVIEEVTQEK